MIEIQRSSGIREQFSLKIEAKIDFLGKSSIKIIKTWAFLGKIKSLCRDAHKAFNEIDFIIAIKKICPIEYTKDYMRDNNLEYLPVYMAQFL